MSDPNDSKMCRWVIAEPSLSESRHDIPNREVAEIAGPGKVTCTSDTWGPLSVIPGRGGPWRCEQGEQYSSRPSVTALYSSAARACHSSMSSSQAYINQDPPFTDASATTSTIPAVPSTSTSTPDPLQRSRNRASRACASCSRQKLRCDGDQPCSRCVASKTENSCEYLPSLRGKTRKCKRKAGEGEDNDRTDRAGSEDDRQPRLDPRLVMWRRDNSFPTYGPTNAALWGEGAEPARLSHHRPILPHTSPGQPVSGSRGQLHVSEKLTTLPLPGDAHNPLAVLAEASATARSELDVNSPRTAMLDGSKDTKPAEAGEYYMPLERVVVKKDEAPHIMGYIKVHEYACGAIALTAADEARAEQLFDTYFKYLHPHLPFLDREHALPIAVARRNNFLFNASELVPCLSLAAADVSSMLCRCQGV